MKLLLHARRGHSQLDHTRFGAPLACSWGRGARGCACARSYAPTADGSSAAEISWACPNCFRNIIFLATVRFSRKITTPPQVLEQQVQTPAQLQRIAAVAPKGVRDGGFEVAYMYHDSATAVRSSSNGAQKEVG